jgi:hypothetical protein
MATLDDAIELLRDPANLTELGESEDGFGVKTRQVIRLLGVRGAGNQHEALSLIRRATKALGGGEVIVRRPGALRVDHFGGAPAQAEPAFWIPSATND